MAYIPKNKIQTGLHTSDTTEYSFETANKEIYVGPYYKLYNGKYFSGNTPNDPKTKEIFIVTTTFNEDIHNSPYPPSLETGIFFSDEVPINNLQAFPLDYYPTSQDYKIGEYKRCFSVKRNQKIFIEISRETYNKFQQQDISVPWQLYKVFYMPWLLTGDISHVAKVNKNITELTEYKDSLFGLSSYLKYNWTKYYKDKL